MLLVVSKVIPTLLFPVGLTIILCLLAAWLAFRKGAGAAGIVSLCAACVLYVAANPIVSNRLLLGLERQHPPALENPEAAAIVLLGGGMAPMVAPRVYPETNAAGDRLLHAGRLWKQGLAPVLVATGGYISFMSDASGSEADQYAAALRELFGVPDTALLTVPDSRTTAEDATLAATLFSERGLEKNILLVTSATHMPRAAALFRKNGFVVHPAPTDYRGAEWSGFKVFSLLPSGSALAETYVALHEYVGIWAYRVVGKL